MEFIRTFIAIELPEEIKLEMERLQTRLKLKTEAGVTCVKPAASHLTLKFLGNTPVEQVPEIQEIMERVVKGVHPFVLELKGVGCFPDIGRPRVVWVGLAGDEDLPLLQMGLEDALAELGYVKEDREFTAHLTLARLRDDCLPDARRRIGEMVQATDYQPGLKFTAESINLIQSVLKRSGPEYTTLYRACLPPAV